MLDTVLAYDIDGVLTATNKIFTIQLYAMFPLLQSDINQFSANYITFDSASYDTINNFNVNGNVLQCTEAATYLVNLSLSVESGSSSECIITVNSDSSGSPTQHTRSLIISGSTSSSCIMQLSIDDTISIQSLRSGDDDSKKIILADSAYVLIQKIA
jgi:hypothetical protein